VLRQRGFIVIASVPLDDIERIATLPCVRQMEFGHTQQPKMDMARKATGIDKIHNGVDLPQAYSGAGVVTGICDAGFDPNHVNFLDLEGKTRFGYMSRIYNSKASDKGYVYENYFPRSEYDWRIEHGYANKPTYILEDFKTDNYETYHGTHTLGAMAGGYAERVTMGKLDANGTASVQSGWCPYYGGAIESEIVASCGDLKDEFIALGVEDVINYARLSGGTDEDGNGAHPKPCVINLSLGSTLGSHDKNSVMNKFLREAGKSAIICVAAGNEGEMPISLHKEFTEGDTLLRSFIVPLDQFTGAYTEEDVTYYNIRSGAIYLYSIDSTPVDVQAVIYNSKRGTIAMRMPIGQSTSDAISSWASESAYDIYGNAITNNATFRNAFDGFVAVAGLLDAETDRYQAIISFFLSDNQTKNADSNYLFGLEVKAKPGQEVYAYMGGAFCKFTDRGEKGWHNGQYDGTISDMACADNILVVGSYNTRYRWASIDGKEHGYEADDLPEGDISYFSSYGTMPDGTTLPHVCAPGAAIISSVNTWCVENAAMNYQQSALQASYSDDNRNYYWQQSIGTSMATPVVAGAIALWLEADPTLTIDDVKDIIAKTAIRDEFVKNGVAAQWGAGKFDAYAGLKEVLRRKQYGAIDPVHADSRLLLTPAGERQFTVCLPNANSLNIALCSVNGITALQQQTLGNETTLDVASLPQGIYVISVNGISKRIILH